MYSHFSFKHVTHITYIFHVLYILTLIIYNHNLQTFYTYYNVLQNNNLTNHAVGDRVGICKLPIAEVRFPRL